MPCLRPDSGRRKGSAGMAKRKVWQHRTTDDGESNGKSWLLRTSTDIRHSDLSVCRGPLLILT
ncbi:conserved hypothetical protein [Ralstonia solanacearum K60]|nr:conserved hypothetical protein [Ralstonia solanacearum K60]